MTKIPTYKTLTPRQYSGSTHGDFGYEIDGVKSIRSYATLAQAKAAMYRALDKLQRGIEETENQFAGFGRLALAREYKQHIPKQNIEKVKTILESPACKQLTENQTQLDQDGCIVGVSRQAIEDTLSALNDLE